ncbi:myocardin isoform X4 [Rhinatrema bivittatum]|uniref:myocardin isoform X4 n=1 Tax=Rhinatrema bivittatum TaxID=194408 RepID=UPI00112C5676|nr:myocardin isoform X4 [Rhinatrema bivittatum]
MTLLGSEHSLLIRSKFRSVLQLRLQQRRTREQLVDQGIMAPLKSPGAFHEQRKSLEKDKTEDYLKHKMRNRPERSDLVNLHVLQDSAAEGSIQTAQMKLKRARLADDLNEKIAVRPGPLELVEKNIIPVDSAMKEAMKGNHVSLSKSADAFTFEEDSSNDELSPEHPKHEESQDTAATSPPQTKIAEVNASTASGTMQNQDSDKEVNESESALNNQNLKEMNGHLSAPIPVPAAIKSKSSGDSKNRHKKPKDTKPKVKKLKYHQYIPPDQKAEKSPPPMDSAYARLLQQQQLFLQLQILSQQQQQQQHFNYPGIHPTQLKQPSNPAVRNSNSSSSMVSSSPSLSPEKTTFSGQASVASLKPDPLPSNLDDLKSTVVPSGSPGCFSSNQPSRQAPFLSNNAESKQSHRDAPSPHSPNIQQQMAGSQSSSQTGPKFSISSSSFCNSSSAHSKIKQPPSYEDAMKQQISRSQQMDELLDVLIESGEMPANAKEEHSCPPKVPHITVSVSSASVSGAFDHCPSSNDNHLEVLLNSQNLLGRTSDATLLKIGGDASHFEGVMDGFSAKAPEELLTSREILDSALPPVETRLCSPSLEGSALPHLSFTESPWETMEWLDLTPPSSATGFGSLTSTGPSIFNTDFLDVTDLNLNTAMDLHLEQW